MSRRRRPVRRPTASTTWCRIQGCQWEVTLPEPRDRDRAWRDHWRANHGDPSDLTTRCTVPGCGWTHTDTDLAELRVRAADHRATHEGTPTR